MLRAPDYSGPTRGRRILCVAKGRRDASFSVRRPSQASRPFSAPCTCAEHASSRQPRWHGVGGGYLHAPVALAAPTSLGTYAPLAVISERTSSESGTARGSPSRPRDRATRLARPTRPGRLVGIVRVRSERSSNLTWLTTAARPAPTPAPRTPAPPGPSSAVKTRGVAFPWVLCLL